VIRALSDAVGLDFDQRTMVPKPDDSLPFETLPSDRKWHPLLPDPWLEHVGEEEAEIVDARCGALATLFGYTTTGTTLPSGAVELLGAEPQYAAISRSISA
jgi:hypothetical protein